MRFALPQRDGSRRGVFRRGFTLIELLVVVTIVAVLAAIIMNALADARQRSLELKTRSTIIKIDNNLMSRWQQFETRRVQFDPATTQARKTGRQTLGPRQRLDAVRELMRLEFPERWNDVETQPRLGLRRPAASVAYKRRYDRTMNARGDGLAKNHRERQAFQHAECLYMILTTPMGGEESAREIFKDSEIGDIDSDGFSEFLDAWENPIMFLRWAPGFVSDLQPDEARTRSKEPQFHDPFDPNGVQSEAFALYPLVYSAGRDQQYDIFREREGGGQANDPYSGENREIGVPRDGDNFRTGGKDGRVNAFDNIHNHSLGAR